MSLDFRMQLARRNGRTTVVGVCMRYAEPVYFRLESVGSHLSFIVAAVQGTITVWQRQSKGLKRVEAKIWKTLTPRNSCNAGECPSFFHSKPGGAPCEVMLQPSSRPRMLEIVDGQ